jgi:hypothetical protein
MNSLWKDRAFSVSGTHYSWSDAAAAAVLRGDWASLEEQTRKSLALLAQAEATENGASEQELEAAAEEFRYGRDLVTAEEMEGWLDRRGLTVEDWMAYIERATVRGSDPGEEEEALASFAPSDGEVAGCILTEAICSGALERFAQTLAGRAAVAPRAAAEAGAGEEPSLPEIERAASDCAGTFSRMALPPASPERIAELLRLERLYEAWSRTFADPAAVRALIDAHRLDWIRLDLRDLGFSDETAAREAALCVREDSESLETVAQEAHRPIAKTRPYLAEVEESVRPGLLSARPGDLIGPVPVGDEFHLYELCGKTPPSEQDPEIRSRAENALLAKIVEHEIAARVHWHEPISQSSEI